MMTASKLAVIIERALLRSAPKGRSFYVTSTQLMYTAQAVLIAMKPKKESNAMAHWHDYNPWATELVYLPSLEEAAACAAGGTIGLGDGTSLPYDTEYLVKHWLHTSAIRGTAGKLDAYLLRDGPLSRGRREMHLGIRFGKEPEEYHSPMVQNQALALELYHKYGGVRD